MIFCFTKQGEEIINDYAKAYNLPTPSAGYHHRLRVPVSKDNMEKCLKGQNLLRGVDYTLNAMLQIPLVISNHPATILRANAPIWGCL